MLKSHHTTAQTMQRSETGEKTVDNRTFNRHEVYRQEV